MSDFLNKYPYTDFHELNLDWVIERVKKLTEDWLATQDAWNDTQEQWQQLYDYVHDYFDNLDVSQEISDKIDVMVLNGTFLNVIKSTVEAQTITTTTSWLANHITQPTVPVIDNTLTIGSAGADAAKTGLMCASVYSALKTYAINDIVNYNGTLYKCIVAITTAEAWNSAHWQATSLGNANTILADGFEYETSNTIINWIDGSYIVTNTDPVDTTLVSDGSYRCAVIPCAENDVFILNATGGSSPRLWCFTDSSYNVLGKSTANLAGSDMKIIAPAGAEYLILNDKKKTANSYIKENHIKNMMHDDSLTVGTTRNLFDKFEKFNLKIGSSTPGLYSHSGVGTCVKCEPNTKYIITKDSSEPFYCAWLEAYPTEGLARNDFQSFGSLTSGVYQTGASAEYLYLFYFDNTTTETEAEMTDSIMIVKGETVTDYIPHRTALDHELREHVSTIESILDNRKIINVLDYGATGDGITNDRSAIQNIINTYSDTHILYFPAGTYRISSGLVMRASTYIMGSGPKTIIKADSGASYILGDPSVSDPINYVYWHIENIRLQGAGSSYSTVGILLNESATNQILHYSGVTIDNVTIEQCHYGIRGNQKTYLFKGNNLIILLCAVGIYFNGMSDCEFSNLIITSCIIGIYQNRGGNNRVSNAKIYWNGEPIPGVSVPGTPSNIHLNGGARDIYTNIELQDSYRKSFIMENISDITLNGVHINDSGGILRNRGDETVSDPNNLGLVLNTVANVRGIISVADHYEDPVTYTGLTAANCTNIVLMYTEHNVETPVGTYTNVTLI